MRILDGVERMQAALDYHAARENLLVSNMAHADTPGYRPLELERPSFQREMGVALRATDPRHIVTPGGAKAEGAPRVVEDASATAGPDGNGVSLEREATKIAANNVRYDVIATLVAGELGMFAWAANDGRGA